MRTVDTAYDLLIIGGGVNGAGIACDAAGRGLKVALCERGDLAGATSSASSKLIHGGLRYLEYYEFGLVRKALTEREVLLAKAPQIIWPLKFVVPHGHDVRPAWLVRLGLWIYDHLGRRKRLPGSEGLNLRKHAGGLPLKPSFRKGFAYADCWVDDARLVVLNALAAREQGAQIWTRTELVAAERQDDRWQATLLDRRTNERRTVQARALVNAAGPWADQILKRIDDQGATGQVRMVKGSHIVVPKLYDGDHAYLLQMADRRVVFVLPFENDFSLVGTTDVPFEDDPADCTISADEIRYLCDAVNDYFKAPLSPDDVCWSYAGVRPLFDDAADDPSAVTRDYVLALDGASTGQAPKPPLLSVYGGKITTYRVLAEEALDQLQPHLPELGAPWTAGTPLPGGDLPDGDFDAFAADIVSRYPSLDSAWLEQLCRRHGSRVLDILDGVAEVDDLGVHYGAGLYHRELAYLVDREWAISAEDVLWRRTKAGLHMDAEARQRVATALATLVSGASRNIPNSDDVGSEVA